MPISLRHRTEARPVLSPLAELDVRREAHADVMAALQNRTETEIARRFAEGHRAYVASLAGEPAAWGWVATQSANIGELESTFIVPSGQRYLWNFVTRPAYRGRGIYPRLLDAIARAEEREAERLWIAYAPENHASGAGIRKAGFTDVAKLSFDHLGRPAIADIVNGGATLAAEFFGIRVVEEPLAQCWRCVKHAGPMHSSCATGVCTCDYQRAEVVCAH